MKRNSSMLMFITVIIMSCSSVLKEEKAKDVNIFDSFNIEKIKYVELLVDTIEEPSYNSVIFKSTSVLNDLSLVNQFHKKLKLNYSDDSELSTAYLYFRYHFKDGTKKNIGLKVSGQIGLQTKEFGWVPIINKEILEDYLLNFE